jgi:hypothetical protein
MLKSFIVFAALLYPTSIYAQTDCKGIQDTAARLACFDAASKSPPPQKKPAKTAAKPSPEDPDSKACTLKVAEVLPKIPGLAIKSSRTAVQPRPANWPGPVPPIMVDMDVVAAGQNETYSFLCATGPAGTVVQRVRK